MKTVFLLAPFGDLVRERKLLEELALNQLSEEVFKEGVAVDVLDLSRLAVEGMERSSELLRKSLHARLPEETIVVMLFDKDHYQSKTHIINDPKRHEFNQIVEILGHKFQGVCESNVRSLILTQNPKASPQSLKSEEVWYPDDFVELALLGRIEELAIPPNMPQEELTDLLKKAFTEYIYSLPVFEVSGKEPVPLGLCGESKEAWHSARIKASRFKVGGERLKRIMADMGNPSIQSYCLNAPGHGYGVSTLMARLAINLRDAGEVVLLESVPRNGSAQSPISKVQMLISQMEPYSGIKFERINSIETGFLTSLDLGKYDLAVKILAEHIRQVYARSQRITHIFMETRDETVGLWDNFAFGFAQDLKGEFEGEPFPVKFIYGSSLPFAVGLEPFMWDETTKVYPFSKLTQNETKYLIKDHFKDSSVDSHAWVQAKAFADSLGPLTVGQMELLLVYADSVLALKDSGRQEDASLSNLRHSRFPDKINGAFLLSLSNSGSEQNWRTLEMIFHSQLGLRRMDLKNAYEWFGFNWSDSEYLNLINLLSPILIERLDGRIDFSGPKAREMLMDQELFDGMFFKPDYLEHMENYGGDVSDAIYEALMDLPDLDPVKRDELFHQGLKGEAYFYDSLLYAQNVYEQGDQYHTEVLGDQLCYILKKGLPTEDYVDDLVNPLAILYRKMNLFFGEIFVKAKDYETPESPRMETIGVPFLEFYLNSQFGRYENTAMENDMVLGGIYTKIDEMPDSQKTSHEFYKFQSVLFNRDAILHTGSNVIDLLNGTVRDFAESLKLTKTIDLIKAMESLCDCYEASAILAFKNLRSPGCANLGLALVDKARRTRESLGGWKNDQYGETVKVRNFLIDCAETLANQIKFQNPLDDYNRRDFEVIEIVYSWLNQVMELLALVDGKEDKFFSLNLTLMRADVKLALVSSGNHPNEMAVELGLTETLRGEGTLENIFDKARRQLQDADGEVPFLSLSNVKANLTSLEGIHQLILGSKEKALGLLTHAYGIYCADDVLQQSLDNKMGLFYTMDRFADILCQTKRYEEGLWLMQTLSNFISNARLADPTVATFLQKRFFLKNFKDLYSTLALGQYDELIRLCKLRAKEYDQTDREVVTAVFGVSPDNYEHFLLYIKGMLKYLTAHAYLKKGFLWKAQEEYEAAIKLFGTNPSETIFKDASFMWINAYYQIMLIKLKLGQMEEAKATYMRLKGFIHETGIMGSFSEVLFPDSFRLILPLFSELGRVYTGTDEKSTEDLIDDYWTLLSDVEAIYNKGVPKVATYKNHMYSVWLHETEAKTYLDLGDAYLKIGKTHTAGNAYRSGADVAEGLIDALGWMDHKTLLVNALSKLATARLAEGNFKECLELTRQSMDLLSALDEWGERVIRIEENALRCLRIITYSEASTERLSKTYLREALEIIKEAEKTVKTKRAKDFLCEANLSMGRSYLGQGEATEALESIMAAVVKREGMLGEYGFRDGTRTDYAKALVELGEYHLSQGEIPEAYYNYLLAYSFLKNFFSPNKEDVKENSEIFKTTLKRLADLAGILGIENGYIKYSEAYKLIFEDTESEAQEENTKKEHKI